MASKTNKLSETNQKTKQDTRNKPNHGGERLLW
jgi:hypothetical protein